MIAVIGICLFLCGILIAINTLYDLQTISLPIHTQYNLKVQDLDDGDPRRRAMDLDDAAERSRIQKASKLHEENEHFEPTKVVFTHAVPAPQFVVQPLRPIKRHDEGTAAPKPMATADQDAMTDIVLQSKAEEQREREEQDKEAAEQAANEAAKQQREEEEVKQRKDEAAKRAANRAATLHQVKTPGTTEEERKREEAAGRQREEEEVQRVKEALLEYFREPNRMSMYASSPPFPLTPEQAKVEVEIWLSQEGTEFIKTKFREQHWQGQIDRQTCLTKLQMYLFINRTSTWSVKIDENVVDRNVQEEHVVSRSMEEKHVVDRSVQEEHVVDRIVQGMLKDFSTSNSICIINNFHKDPLNECSLLNPENAEKKVMIWIQNGGEEFIKCEFRKTGEQIDPLSYTDVLLLHSSMNSELYGGLLMLKPAIPYAPGIHERVASCTKR